MNYAELEAIGERALLDAREQQIFEDLHLDFKGSGEKLFDAVGNLTKDGRRSLAKAASAFANTGGGLIILGVDCREIDGVDTISDLSPIPNFARSASAVNSALGELTDPPIAGIRMLRIPASGQDDAGYMAIDVPRSERRPHASRNDFYYRRSGNVSFKMSHYELEDAFKRVVSPDLQLRWAVVKGVEHAEGFSLRLQFHIVNQGHATARSVALGLKEWTGIPLNFPWDKQFRTHQDRGSFVVRGPSDLVINPGQGVPFHYAAINVRVGDGLVTVGGLPAFEAFIAARIELSAENMAPHLDSLEVGPDAFASFANIRGS